VLTNVGGPTNQVGISYTSNWSFNGATGTGSGSGLYTDPDFSFDIDLVNLEVSGSVSVTYGIASLSLSGAKSVSEGKLSVTGAADVIDVPGLGAVAGADLTLEYNQISGVYDSSISAGIIRGITDVFTTTQELNNGTITSFGGTGFTTPTGPGSNNGLVTTVPEPGTISLLGIGLVVIMVLLATRRVKCNC
jgi:hypothetical protein